MARKIEQVQRHHLTDEQWEKFDHLMNVMVRLKRTLLAQHSTAGDGIGGSKNE